MAEWRFALLTAQIEAVRDFLVPRIVTELGNTTEAEDTALVCGILKTRDRKNILELSHSQLIVITPFLNIVEGIRVLVIQVRPRIVYGKREGQPLPSVPRDRAGRLHRKVHKQEDTNYSV